MEAGFARGVFNLGAARPRMSVGDVLGDGAGENKRVLTDVAEDARDAGPRQRLSGCRRP